MKDDFHLQHKDFEIVHYGHPLYLKYVPLEQLLWSRGFIDKNIYLANKEGNQSLFTIEPKKGLYGAEGKKDITVLFGSEVLIKHTLSEHYISVKEVHEIPILQFHKQESSSCYFEFISLRTFEGRGDPITTDSLFLIEHSQRKLYITPEQQEKDIQSPSPVSPKFSKKIDRIPSKEKKFQKQFRTESEMPKQLKRSSDSQISISKKGFELESDDDYMRQSISKRVEKKKSFQKGFNMKSSQIYSQVSDQIQVANFKKATSKLRLPDLIVRAISHQPRKNQDNIQEPNTLIVYKPEKSIKPCHVENYYSRQWKIQLANCHLKTSYLQNYEFVYFTYSQDDSVLAINIEKKPFEATYQKNSEQFLSSSIFVVEMQSQDQVYLRHYLTGRYFPLSDNPNERQRFRLVPLLPPKKNYVPPFKIVFETQLFSLQGCGDGQHLHGFWLNKAPKKEIAQIMSFQNVKRSVSLNYFIQYLRKNSNRGQKILREFQFIPYIIQNMIPNEQDEAIVRLCYKLLFYICKNNPINKKKCVIFIQKILASSKKQLILDLLTELLQNSQNSYVIEKFITPKIIESQVREFIQSELYSIQFMRIFRVFCGSQEQNCIRNQNLIFNLFFWGKPVNTGRNMTQSALNTQKQVQVSQIYKFRLFQKQNQIYLSNGNQQEPYQNWRKQTDIIQYIRQYFYLLADCMNNNNYQIIQRFTEHVKISNLLFMLKNEEMKGPCLAMITNGYLKTQKYYKPQIFHKDYDQICLKGSMIAMNTSNDAEQLKNFIIEEIKINKDYQSTAYRILLNAFRFTIDNGYWKSYEQLLQIVNNLHGVMLEPVSTKQYHENYEEKVEQKNLMKSKIISISIKIALIDLQISLWVSDLVSGIYTEQQIDKKIIVLIKSNKDWIIDQKIFRLCSTNSPELMKKSLLLMYKIYNIKKIFYKTYIEAKIQINSNLQLSEIFSIFHSVKSQLSIDNYFSLVAACVKDVTMEQLNPQYLNRNYRSLESLLKYKQVNQQVQNMAFKLGIHQYLLRDLKRFGGLRKKQKQEQAEITYWKLLLLYAMIRNNLKLRDLISEYRHYIINIIESEDNCYYVAADILEQIYRNNRKLIISDTQYIKQICEQISKVFNTQNGEINLKSCKVVNLLGVFIQSGNRKIMQNHQLILKNVFTKNVINRINNLITLKMGQKQVEELEQQKQKNDKKNKFQLILQVVIYDLLNSMGQKKLLMQFSRPNNQTINSLLLSIGSANWNLKSKVFSCINFNEKMPDKLPIQFMNLVLYDLNVMCESLLMSAESEFKLFSKEVKIYVSNMRKILGTINRTFRFINTTFNQKLQSIESEEAIQMIKIVERLFIIKNMCPQIIRKDIDGLLIYIEYIEEKMKKNNFDYDIIRSIIIMQLQDFTKKQLKDKMPLIFSQKIKKKEARGQNSWYEYIKNLLEMEVSKKMRWTKMNKGNLETFSVENIKSQMIELETFITCIGYVNKTDPTVLQNNIKEFLVNFLRTSYLSGRVGTKLMYMQNILVSYEIPSVICSFLSEPFQQRFKLFSSTFHLGIKLLEGGHTPCQQKFLDYFKRDAKNRMFHNIYYVMQDTIKTIQFYYKYQEDPTFNSYEMMLQFEQVYICKEEMKFSCKLLSQTFRFLQLLCQNDNHEMKEYVYNQYDVDGQIKYMSKNFIQVASMMLERVFDVLAFNIDVIRKYPDPKFEEEVRNNIFILPNFILDFLIEVCQIPAQQNQLYLCRTDFFDFIKNLMVLRENCQKYDKEMFFIQGQSIFFQIERKIIILLRSLLEQDSEEIINLMSKKIGKSQFQFFIQESCVHGGLQDTEKLKQMWNSYKLNGYIENILDILIVKKVLKSECIFSFDKHRLSIINELNARIQSIHVDFKGQSITVYFPFHPLFSLLKKKTKLFLMDRTASLNTRKQKITEFLLSREIVYQDINQQRNSEKRLITETHLEYIFNFSLFLCYLIIVLLVMFFSVGKYGVVLDIYQTRVISWLSYMQLSATIIYTLFLGLNQANVVKQKLKTKHRYRQRIDILEGKNILKQKQSSFSTLSLLKAIYLDQSESFPSLVLLIISLYACFGEVRVYALSLLFIFVKIQFLQSIFKAIKLTWQQLIFVSIFALAFSLIFGFLTINNYIGPLYQNQAIDIDINRINQHCNSMFTCVGSLYTQKIIGQSVSRQDQQYDYSRFISDLIYDAFFNIFLANIIAAIIIDKFAQQRNVKQKIQNDRYSICYVCFADKNTLERRGQDFNSHVTKVHNLWNYFFYMYTLENLKDITDFTGIQYWINRQVQQNFIDWVPIDDSLKQEALTNAVTKNLEKKKFAQFNVDEDSD